MQICTYTNNDIQNLKNYLSTNCDCRKLNFFNWISCGANCGQNLIILPINVGLNRQANSKAKEYTNYTNPQKSFKSIQTTFKNIADSMNSGGFRIILYSTFHPTHCSLLSRVQLTIQSHMCSGFQFQISVTKNVIWSSQIRGKISEISYAFDLSLRLYSVKCPYEHTVAIAFIIMTNGVSNVFLCYTYLYHIFLNLKLKIQDFQTISMDSNLLFSIAKCCRIFHSKSLRFCLCKEKKGFV